MKPVQSLKYYWLFTKAIKVLLILISIKLLIGQLQEIIKETYLFGYGLEINGNKSFYSNFNWGAKYNRVCVGLHLVIVKRTDNELNDNKL